MNKSHYILVVILAFLAGAAGVYVGSANHNPASSEAKTAKENVYDRVMRTQTIRCGYSPWPPILIKDPNTGELSGIAHDYVEALGHALHLKIDWSEEVPFADMPVALNSGRVDAICVDVWPTAARAREIDFTRPTYYTPIYAYVRNDDHRFDNNLSAINDPSVTAATMDGEMSSIIAAADYPKAKTLQLESLASSSELMSNIATGKADITFTDPMTAHDYDINNPGKIRRVMAPAPLRIFGSTIAIARGQDEFRQMLDTTAEELLSSGVIDKILPKYEKVPGTLLRVAPPYQQENSVH